MSKGWSYYLAPVAEFITNLSKSTLVRFVLYATESVEKVDNAALSTV